MYASIRHMITEPWLCSLEGIQYVDDASETSPTYSDKQTDAYSFIVVVRGSGILECSDSQTKVEAGSICLVRANQSFSVTTGWGGRGTDIL